MSPLSSIFMKFYSSSYVVQQNDTHFFLNNYTYVPPKVPVLLQILSGKCKPEELMPKGSIIPLPINKSIEINFPHKAKRGIPHPFHLHGVRPSSFPPRPCEIHVERLLLTPVFFPYSTCLL